MNWLTATVRPASTNATLRCAPPTSSPAVAVMSFGSYSRSWWQCHTPARMLGKSMQIIPVIDVRHGQAVRAVRGDRSNYRALVTPLAVSADPLEVARGYLRL